MGRNRQRPPCFTHGGYDEEFSRVFVQFSDNSIYEYPDFTLEEWIEWKDAYPRGTYFNHTWRNTDIDYTELNIWPNGLTYTF
jgi:hypothetical protein